MRKAVNSDETRPISRYAAKKRAQESGARAPFQFQDTHHPWDKGAYNPFAKLPAATRGVWAQITYADFKLGYLFAETETREVVYISYHVVQSGYAHRDISVGWFLECEIDPIRTHKRRRVSNVHSVRHVKTS